MHRLLGDEPPRVLLEHDLAARDQVEQSLIKREAFALVFERFSKDVSDVVATRLEKPADRQGRMLAQKSDHLAGLLGMPDAFDRLLAKPCDDRDPRVSEDHEGVVRVPHYPGELGLQDPVQDIDDRFFVEVLFHGRLSVSVS